ncbi:MAG: aminodeoxychorismate/anthranilate synthase component II [Dehalococcoidia bacterium]|jgi:anthranilate synthase/aminodeoxychorismate synthase-like glutamine amidotransferase|nr:aminodeoxychorismate/anthranilate synthase component II [Dehalococcoidia bacterium]
MLLLIDNYDSFTYNLYQYLCELGAEVEVVRNDAAGLDELIAMKPERVVVSPGPSTPDKAGVSIEAIRHFGQQVPLLGVCLGHQCIGEAFGAKVAHAGEIMHGKTSMISNDGKGVFAGLPDPFEAVRYHSLAIDPDSIPDVLEVTAHSPGGIIQGVRHRELPVEGVQFHPESILTGEGKKLLQNFLDMKAPASVGA